MELNFFLIYMNEKFNLILIISAFVLLIGWQIFDFLKLNKRLKSKNKGHKRNGIRDLNEFGNENILSSLIDTISTILKKIF